MTDHFRSLKVFPPFQQLALIYGMLVRKLIGSDLSSLMKTKFVVDRVLNKGGTAERINDLIYLEYKHGRSASNGKFFIRKNSSDAVIFNEILLQSGGDYRWVERIALENNIGIKTIVDAGANIGSASVFFGTIFPEAAMLSIEPEPGNFFLLEKNLAINNYHTIQPFQNAFWINNEGLSIGSGPRGQREKELSYGIVKEDTGIRVKGLSFADCLRILKTDRIDLLKIDIEGAEKEIINDKEGFSFLLAHIRILAIELHAEIIDPFWFIGIMENAGFSHIQDGEILICWKKSK